MLVFMQKIEKAVNGKCVRLWQRINAFRDDIRALGTVEIVLLVAVLVALALLFKTFITRYANNMFDNIESKTGEALSDW